VTSHVIIIKCSSLARDRKFWGKTGNLGFMRRTEREFANFS
jgi:hypothetical protein